MEKDGLVEELLVQGHAKVAGNGAQVIIGDGLPDDAATLINTVRKRYFENGNDPDPVTAAGSICRRLCTA